jgi:Spy/CpxP family protein refolding chaperone
MVRTSSRAMVAMTTLGIVVAMGQLAMAQRGEGGRRGGRGMGGFAMSTADLASMEQVQNELKLSEDQKAKVADITDKLREDRRGLFQPGGGGGASGREEIEKLNKAASAKIAEVLDEAQQKRLIGVLAQVNLDAALNEPSVVKELSITDDQRKKLADAGESNRETMRAARDEMRDLSPEERREKMNSMRSDAEKKLLAVLTSDQQAQLEQLKGAKVEIDMAQFRGPGGGGRGRGGDRGGRGGNNTN